MMTEFAENTPARVNGLLRQPCSSPTGTVLDRWSWTKPWVWTNRMLTTLELGVKGGKWYSLFDKVFDQTTLYAAARRMTADLRKAAGVDHVTPAHFAKNLPEHVVRLAEQLRNGTYRPQAIRRVWIDKPGSREQRPLGIPTVRDRIVQAALRDVIEPIFERDFAGQSYGFRPGRGCKDALRRVDALLNEGYTIVVDVDLKSYFDTIPHEPLLDRIRSRISDRRVLSLIAAFLQQGVLEDMRHWTPETGSPQGAVISPLLSNIYLDPLDHLMAAAGYEMVRYADDFVILCRSHEEAEAALALVREWTAEAGLTLHPTKTKIADATTAGFGFLGYVFKGGSRFPRKQSLEKLKQTIRRKTRRANGQSLNAIIADVNVTLRGWFGYFKHIRIRGRPGQPAKRYVFSNLDSWTRTRLRSILRKRSHRRGKARAGRDNQRWPNAFFATRGLYNLKTAHEEACQSLSR